MATSPINMRQRQWGVRDKVRAHVSKTNFVEHVYRGSQPYPQTRDSRFPAAPSVDFSGLIFSTTPSMTGTKVSVLHHRRVVVGG